MRRLMAGSGTTRGAQRMSSEPVGRRMTALASAVAPVDRRQGDRRPGLARCRGDPRRGGRRPRRARLPVAAVRRHGRRPARRRAGAARPWRPDRRGGGDRRQRWRGRRLAGDQDLRDLLDRRPGARRVTRLRRHRVRRARRAGGGRRHRRRRQGFERDVEGRSRRARRRHRRHHGGGDDVRRHPRPQPRRHDRRHGSDGRRGRRPRPSRRRRPRDGGRTRDRGSRDRGPCGDGRRGMAATVGPGRADRLLRRPGRHGRAAGPRRGARRIDDRRAPAVRRRVDARRGRLPVDRRRRHRLRALHQPAVHRRRPLPRPHPAGVARLRRRRRAADAGLGDVHRQGPRRRRPRARRLGRAAHAVARPREPVLGLDEDGKPKVVGLTDDAGNCPPGSVNAGGENPMVHVWIAPHECGPFAALEGHGAGQAATTGARADQCAHDHEATAAEEPATAAYDPTKPIDLSGVEGVTPEQQAFAENLVAVTLVRLPQWSDPAVAEAAGFHSIGDAGHRSRALRPVGLDRRRRVARPRRSRRASSTSRSPTAPRSSSRRCTCCRRRWPSRTCPTSAAR